MRRLLLASLLFLALALPIAPVDRAVHIVIVEPPGQSATPEEAAHIAASAAGAIGYWEALSPIPTRLSIVSTETVTISVDALSDLEWSRPWLRDANPDVTLFVIDNSQGHGLLLGNTAGQAQDYYGVIWVVYDGYPGPEGLGAAIAHELGHVLYGLDDLYDMKPIPDDIMGYPSHAYKMHFIGCTSGALLGAPCHRVYLPLFSR